MNTSWWYYLLICSGFLCTICMHLWKDDMQGITPILKHHGRAKLGCWQRKVKLVAQLKEAGGWQR